jgi:fructose-bisphosphate aldolase class I
MEQSQMNIQQLMDTARSLVAADQGLLAMDESHPTCNKRFAKLGIRRGIGIRFNFHGDFL